MKTFPDAPFGEVDIEELVNTVARANEAYADGHRAATEANGYAEKAVSAQQRISAHNDECSRRFRWSRPNNWHQWQSPNGYSYRGYAQVNPATGNIAPHGEGESLHPNGLYRCANFNYSSIEGLNYEIDGGVKIAGLEQESRGTAQFHMRDENLGAAFIGTFVNHCLTIGHIAFPGGSLYHGYCGRPQQGDRAVPTGFGIWNSGQALAVMGFFVDGFLEGVAGVQESPSKYWGGLFSVGRLLKRSSSSQPIIEATP